MNKRLLSLLLSTTAIIGCANWRDHVYPSKDTGPVGHLFPHRAANIHTLEASCTQAGQKSSDVPEQARMLWENLQAVKDIGTMTGAALLETAQNYELFYCAEEMPPDYGGAYKPGSAGMILISNLKEISDPARAVSQMHETTHATQDLNHSFIRRPGWRLEDYQARTLSAEAAAASASFLFAVEARALGDDRFWQSIIAPDSRQTVLEMTETFAAAKISGARYEKAVIATGEKGISAMFNRQHWLDIYNKSILADFVDEIINDKLVAPGSDAPFTAEEARNMGKLSRRFNITANIKLPPYEKRFGKNKSMRAAFEAAEFFRHEKTLGANHAKTKRLRAALVSSNNQYLELGLNQIASILGVQKKEQRR